MTRDEVKKILFKILEEAYDHMDEAESVESAFKEEYNLFDDLGLDSLSLFMLITGIEEEFNIKEDMSDGVLDAETVGGVIDFITEYINK